MQITCPDCSTHYLVDPQTIGPTGRLVRCARCSRVWRQPPPDEAAPAPPPTPPEDETPSQTAPPDEPAPSGEAPARGGPPAQGVPPAQDVPPAPGRGRKTQLPALAEDGKSGLIGWAVLAAVVLSVVVGATVFRNGLVAAWPPAARLYHALGLSLDEPVAEPAAPAAPVLEFKNLQTELRAEGDGTTLTVSGAIRNAGAQEAAVPPVRVTLLDANQKAVFDWVFKPAQDHLAPGGTLAFETRATNPPAAQEVRLTFEQQENHNGEESHDGAGEHDGAHSGR